MAVLEAALVRERGGLRSWRRRRATAMAHPGCRARPRPPPGCRAVSAVAQSGRTGRDACCALAARHPSSPPPPWVRRDMRLLLINPNTTDTITGLVAERARAVAGAGVEIRAVTGRFGPRYVASRAAAVVAGHAALDLLAEHVEGCDAVLLACFGDPGLLALKELSPVPVIGMAEASCHLACLLGQRFSIVTGGERWGPMLREFVGGLGLERRLASVRTVAPTGADIARDPEGSLALLAASCAGCAEADGAEVVVLGGAGLAGLARRVAPEVPVPVICSLEAAVLAALAAGRLASRRALAGSLAPRPPVATVGLPPALSHRLDPDPVKRPDGHHESR